MTALGASRAKARGWQNVYVYSKAMGEMLVGQVVKERGLPVAVVRPSIIEGALEGGTLEGWVEGMRMADPVFIAYGKGVMDGFAMPQ
jgi:alcohol-forming fatty acyl-CoA reductase